MSRHLVELGVSVRVERNEWGQIIIDIKCPEAHPQVRVNNVVFPEPGLSGERVVVTDQGHTLAERVKCGND